MASTEVIREYLTKIGYITDAVSQKKAEDGMAGFGKKVFSVGAAVTGLVASVGAATAAFAYSMRKMYYQSELSGSTVKNMNAMSYAAEQIGMSGDTMAGAIHSMAQAIRLNPGLQAFVEGLGVKVTGRDMSDVVLDFASAMKKLKMPEFAAAQWAQQFGMDPDTLHTIWTHMDDISKKKREMKGMYKEVGFDPDASKKSILALTSELDRLEARASLVGQKLLVSLVGPLLSVMNVLEEGFNRFAKIIGGFKEGHGIETWLEAQKEAFAHPFGKPTEKETKEAVKKKAESEKRTSAAASTMNEDLAAYYNIPSLAELNKKKAESEKRTVAAASDITGAMAGGEPGNFSTGENTRLGATTNATSVNQTNHIVVHGVTNPQETANATAREITRTFGNITRTGRGATLP